MTPPPRLLLAVAIGGASGAVARHFLGTWVPERLDFPWTTFGINVVGSFLLALLPAIAYVRRSPTWTAALGPGLLGGFTTLSAYAEETRALLADEQLILAAVYAVGTLVACLAAALLAGHLSAPRDRDLPVGRGAES